MDYREHTSNRKNETLCLRPKEIDIGNQNNSNRWN